MSGFRGTSRYEIVRELGTGGMGVVYEAIDHERGDRRVAIKVLKQRDADSLLRLKREFRALADVRHQNLVSLYELVIEPDAWFFTLELVDGTDFVTWLRPGARAAEAPTADLDHTIRSPVHGSAADSSRLRDAFRQLAEGVAFLHSTGRIHRDLKPSNVLVTPEGRVVILDFGLVTEAGARSEGETEATIAGTVAYMAPEQAAGAEVGAAADWYAVGVMLFQCLSGRVPFEGPVAQVLTDKQRRPAPELSGEPIVTALCRTLLAVDPGERGPVDKVLERFGASPSVARRLELDFIGRDEQLGRLRTLADEARAQPRVARIIGESGIGKSALLRRFTELEEQRGTVVLIGRCHEREQVPFKALDSVVDALARFLGAEPDERVEAVLPRDAQSLARMFPVLNRVSAFRSAPVRELREPSEVRRRGVAALRELFARVSDRRRLVVIVDDAQWGDADSALVLGEMLKGDDPPCVLIVVASRGDLTAMVGLGVAPVDLSLAPLPDDEARAIALAALGDAMRAEAVARESEGNPFLLQQLIDVAGPVRLADVVTTRLSTLDASARRLLEVVSLAATPVPERVAAQVAELAATDVDTVAELKAGRLLRGVGDDRIEPWHDRIRAAVVSAIAAPLATQLHSSLAEGLRASGADVDVVAFHLSAAGRDRDAASATLAAARQASRQLAFERAVVLYRRVLAQLEPADERRAELCAALGDSLADAGHGKEAADAYGQALAQGATGATAAIELRRRAAEQLLRSGHVDEGLGAIRQVLDTFGMHLARTPRRALVALVFRRAHLRLRGLGYRERAAAELAPDVLQKIDACWSASMGLAMVDTIRGASFQSRQLLLALEAGEPFRVARALGAEAAFVATDGRRAARRAERLIAEARALAGQVADPRLLGLIDFCDGLTRFLSGRWREAAELTQQAERQFTDQGFAVSWEAANSRLFSVWSLFYLGDIAGLSVRIPALVREAEQRGDRYAMTSLQSGLANVSLLARGDAQGAREAVRAAIARWGGGSFHFQHYWALLSEGMIDLTIGDAHAGLTRLEDGWGPLRRSMLLRIQNVRIEATFLRARLLLAVGRISEALEIAFALDDEGVAWARGFSLLLRGLADRREAQALLRSALEVFDAEDMRLFAAVARLRLGEAQPGELGAANQRAAEAWMKTQGIVEPRAFARMLAPTPPSAPGLVAGTR
jgi:tRNA A-37 threonylcarbamoyl transferase component Bud32/tetratricopeptide (TPR) repeat protein